MSCTVVILVFFLKLASSHASFQGEFIVYGSLVFDACAKQNSNGPQALFNKSPLQFKNSSNGSVFSFSTTFIFAIVPHYPRLGGHGLAFAISPSKDYWGDLTGQSLPHVNGTGTENGSKHIVMMDLDPVKDYYLGGINDNHVGIDIDDLHSAKVAGADYHNDESGIFISLNLKSSKLIQVWVDYDGLGKLLNVTIHTVDIPKPKLPLISLQKDLSSYFSEFTHVGFLSDCRILSTSHYILGWSFKMNGHAQQFNLSRIPPIPGGKGPRNIKRMLAVILSLTGGTFLLVLICGALLCLRRRKFIQVLEDWEVLHGPHRFTYKDLFKATKGFTDKQLLGRGGFGRVYRGILPSSNVEIAVKRISHDSRQGMREFVAEIATIGRLRHPNLVRLLGYCRQEGELFLVDDHMPSGSLDKFLYVRQPSTVLNWTQRFKIIKDVASSLFYLHQQWVHVIHRDINPANVLLDNDMNARLGDFGLAKLCDHGNDPQTSHVAVLEFENFLYPYFMKSVIFCNLFCRIFSWIGMVISVL